MVRFSEFGLWCALLLLLAPVVRAQNPTPESLNTIVSRGHVAHWLVCGPFPSDVPGGILSALKNDQPVLGTTDFMATASGIARLRPQHLMRIPAPDGSEAIWQRAGSPEPLLDLKPFFPSASEGVAYAAFYLGAPGGGAVFLDIQSPLGVRLWANGFPIHEYESLPLEQAGQAVVALPLRSGTNLVVMEVPGADFEAVAAARGVSKQALTATALANRPRLRDTSGFAVSVLVKSALPLGPLFVAPDIEDAGTFSGEPGDERQDGWITLYNPQDAFSDPGDIIIKTPGSRLPELVEFEAIAPRTAQRVPVGLPIKDVADGEAMSVSIRLHSGGAEAAFTDAFVVRPGGGQPGTVRLITGHTFEGVSDEVTSARLDAIRNQLVAWRELPGYGFDLAYASQWHPALIALADQRENLAAAAQSGAATVRAPFAPVDERIVSGPLLWRNLQVGLGMARGMLRSAVPQQLYWGAPGIAPQSPQLLRHTPERGFISDLEAVGQFPLARALDLSGGTLAHRRKRPGAGPASIEELREMAAVQRRELAGLGIPNDVLVVENVVTPPEPFYRGGMSGLTAGFPRIALDAAGGSGFFEDLYALGDETLDRLPRSAVYLNQARPGDLLTWPALKVTHARVTRQLFDAETLATFASLAGASYPHASLDLANRQVLFYATPEYLSSPASAERVHDALAGLREAAGVTRDVLDRSLAYLAGKVDTAGNAPLNQGAFESIVVFNPTGQSADLPVALDVPGSNTDGVVLLDDAGAAIPATLRARGAGNRLEFIATAVPPFGYRTWYYQMGGLRARPVSGADLQIESDQLALFLDPNSGAIASLTDKRNGREYRDGLLNQLTLLDEDPVESQGGRELWVTPGQALLEPPTRITSERTSHRETIVVEHAMAGGTVVQRYSLVAGQPWVSCVTTLRGLRLAGGALFATFQMPEAGAGFRFGERFGAIAGARGWGIDTIETRGTDVPGGTLSYPAHQWAAVGPDDAIQVGPDRVVPWTPAIIVHGPDPLLAAAAQALQEALVTRGILSVAHEDQPAAPDFLWTDGTRQKESNDYLAQGYRMRVVIGSPDQNTFCRGVLNQLTATDAAGFSEQIPQGARMLMEDANVPDGAAPVPTLILAGLTPSDSAALVDELSKTLLAGQRYLMPPSACVIPRLDSPAEGGLALLFPDSRGVSQHRDGRLLMGLAHPGQLRSPGQERLEGLLEEVELEYAIHPYSGTWREAGVPDTAEIAHANGYAVSTGLRPGPLPGSQSFLSVSAPGIRIGAIKPSGFPQTTGSRAPSHPRNGMTLLAWEQNGEPWRGTLSASWKILEGRRADVYEAPGAPLPHADAALSLSLRPFEITPLWLAPVSAERPDPLAALARDDDASGAIHTRYWEARRGAAPRQNLPLAIMLRGSLEGARPVVEVVVTNHLSDAPVEGMAILTASNGINFGPQQFYFNIAPGKQHVEPVEVAFSADAGEDRAIAVETSFERQTYRDVLTTANPGPCSITITRTGAQIRAEIRNGGSIHAEGFADLIAGPAHWTELGDAPDPIVAPARLPVSVPPYKAQTLTFTLSDAAASPELCLRLSVNGRVWYQYVDRSAPEQREAPVLEAPASTPASPRGATPPTPPPPRGRTQAQP